MIDFISISSNISFDSILYSSVFDVGSEVNDDFGNEVKVEVGIEVEVDVESEVEN